jgi:hypothetical protein
MGRSSWKSALAAIALTLTVAGCSFAGPLFALVPEGSPMPPATVVPETVPPATVVPATVPPATATPEPPTAAPATSPPELPPAAPTGITYHAQHTPGSGSPGTTTYTVSWSEAPTNGVEIRVSGLTKCLSTVMDEPCIQRHMTLPKGTLELIARAPASKGSVSWAWPTPEVLGGGLASDGTNDYYAFLVGAYSAAGQSRLVIVKSATACPGCVY